METEVSWLFTRDRYWLDETEAPCNVSLLGDGVLVPRPIPKLEAHPLSAVRECFFCVLPSILYNRGKFFQTQPESAPRQSNKEPT
jgi:hypothetical protein